MMGLGSIVGTGVFVSIAVAAGIAGAGVCLALVIAAAVATCNALNSAQLAANHPVSGGTYEYGYRWLNPSLGFAAGWMFLCAKTASAATAALGFAGYMLAIVGGGSDAAVPVAVGTVVFVTLVVLAGVRLSSWVNIAIVSVTLLSLLTFVAVGLGAVQIEHLQLKFEARPLFEASALMFVAYTGYGRIATLGEEVVEPRRTIPRAIVLTLVVSAALYVAVAVVAIGVAGPVALGRAVTEHRAPLEVVAASFSKPVAGQIAVGGMTAMLGVLLNLVLGLSRMALAMSRRGDLPRPLTKLSVAIVLVGVAIAGLAAMGSIRVAWSFSAFTVLIYYSVTNLAALRLADGERMYSRLWAWAGLAACLVLALSIPWRIMLAGVAVLLIGFAIRFGLRMLYSARQLQNE